MHISKIEIKNFRGLKHLDIDDLRMVNVFLGKNNVGKTSILEAIFLTLAPGNPLISVVIDNLRSLVHTNSEDFRFIFYQLNYDNTIEINTKYYYEELEKGLKITPSLQSSVLLSSQKSFKSNLLENSTASASVDKSAVNGLVLNYSYKRRHAKHEYRIAKVELENNAFKQTPAMNAEFLKAIFVTSTNVLNGVNERFEQIIINKQEGEIIEFLKAIDSSIEGLTLGANNIILCDTGFGKRFPINLLGDGVIKLIGILLSIYDTPNGIVLVDEFSNGLHYSALKGFWKALFISAKKNNVQLFLTTHDYEALTNLKNVLEEDAFIIFQPEVRSYTIRKLPNQNYKSYKYDFPMIEMAIDEDNEIR